MATTQEAVQISAIVPTLTVDDLQKSITFYEALGFAIDERWEEKGTLLGVMLRAGKTQIGLNQDDWKKGRDRKKGIGVRLSISTPGSVDEIAKRRRSRYHAQVGAARHGVEEQRVRGQLIRAVPADLLFGSIGVGRKQALSEGGTNDSSGTRFYTVGIFGAPSATTSTGHSQLRCRRLGPRPWP